MIKKLSKYRLEFIVFWSGLAVMVLEIAGSRVLSPYIGASIFVWTSLIGVILLSLSAGYWYGGKLADKGASFSKLSNFLFFASVAVLAVKVFSTYFISVTLGLFNDLRVAAVVFGLVLFGPASFLMGIVSPYAVKLKLKSISVTGRTVGNLYSISTFGSIVGTFLAGFYLFSFFRTSQILLLVSFILAVMSLAAVEKITVNRFLIVAALILFLLGIYFSDRQIQVSRLKTGFIDTDTPYSRILIYDTTHHETQRPVRYMRIDKSASSAIYLDGDDPVFGYLDFFDLANYYNPDIKETLLVGGAGYVFPQIFLRNNPEARMDIVEIDEEQTKLARKYFGLSDDPRMTIYHEDGRTYCRKTDSKYDVIYLDAFSALISIPFHLTTLEFVDDLYSMNNEGGLVMANIISPIEGSGSEMVKSFMKTLSQRYPLVDLYQVYPDRGIEEVQNLVVVGVKSDDEHFGSPLTDTSKEVFGEKLDQRIDVDYENSPVLTDEYAPVESMVGKMLSLEGVAKP